MSAKLEGVSIVWLSKLFTTIMLPNMLKDMVLTERLTWDLFSIWKSWLKALTKSTSMVSWSTELATSKLAQSLALTSSLARISTKQTGRESEDSRPQSQLLAKSSSTPMTTGKTSRLNLERSRATQVSKQDNSWFWWSSFSAKRRNCTTRRATNRITSKTNIWCRMAPITKTVRRAPTRWRFNRFVTKWWTKSYTRNSPIPFPSTTLRSNHSGTPKASASRDSTLPFSKASLKFPAYISTEKPICTTKARVSCQKCKRRTKGTWENNKKRKKIFEQVYKIFVLKLPFR